MAVDAGLKERYAEILADQGFPDWAFDVPPPMPFIGDRYHMAPAKVLAYASAENLNHNRQVASIKSLPDPMARCSWFLADWRRNDPTSTFVHIQPVDNGSLLLAARHILFKLDPKLGFSTLGPGSFLDEIAVGNPGKFSIDPDKIGAGHKRNIDYANDPKKFELMRPSILADIAVLRPEIIILPKSIRNTLLRLEPPIDFHDIHKVIGIYQITAQAINRHIARQLKGRTSSVQPTPFDDWKIADNRLNMRLYLEWLDACVLPEHTA